MHSGWEAVLLFFLKSITISLVLLMFSYRRFCLVHFSKLPISALYSSSCPSFTYTQQQPSRRSHLWNNHTCETITPCGTHIGCGWTVLVFLPPVKTAHLCFWTVHQRLMSPPGPALYHLSSTGHSVLQTDMFNIPGQSNNSKFNEICFRVQLYPPVSCLAPSDLVQCFKCRSSW